MKETIFYKYNLRQSDQSEIVFDIKLDKITLDLIEELPYTPAGTTRKAFGCKNPVCLIQDDEVCPVAKTVQRIADSFKNIHSTEVVEATAISEHRVCTRQCAIQVAAGSVIGIYMATCGCPVFGKLKPMVLFHAPFASLEETEYRVFSMYLLAQFFRAGKKLPCDFTLKELSSLYRDIAAINSLAAAKIREIEKNDATINGLIILDAFARMVSFDLEGDDLAHLEGLFTGWFEPNIPNLPPKSS